MSTVQQSEADLRAELNAITLRSIKMEATLKQKDKQLWQKDQQIIEKDKQIMQDQERLFRMLEQQRERFAQDLTQQRDQLLKQRDQELKHLELELKLYQIADDCHSRYAPWVMTLGGLRIQVVLESTDTIPIILAKVTRAIDTDISRVYVAYRGKLLDGGYPVGHTAKDLGMDQPFPIQVAELLRA